MIEVFWNTVTKWSFSYQCSFKMPSWDEAKPLPNWPIRGPLAWATIQSSRRGRGVSNIAGGVKCRCRPCGGAGAKVLPPQWGGEAGWEREPCRGSPSSLQWVSCIFITDTFVRGGVCISWFLHLGVLAKDNLLNALLLCLEVLGALMLWGKGWRVSTPLVCSKVKACR